MCCIEWYSSYCQGPASAYTMVERNVAFEGRPPRAANIL